MASSSKNPDCPHAVAADLGMQLFEARVLLTYSETQDVWRTAHFLQKNPELIKSILKKHKITVK
jgi:hypothetical protein